jgi:hypothetical protein
VVDDHKGQALAHLLQDEPGRRSNLLSKDEARRIAANIDKLPEPARSGTVTNAVKRRQLSTELFVDRRA